MSDKTLATPSNTCKARPVNDQLFSTRWPSHLIKAVDSFRAEHEGEMTRAAALRLLVRRGLKAEGGRGQKEIQAGV